jgi:hypothetical protein
MSNKTVKRKDDIGKMEATSSDDLDQWKLLNPHKNISHS